jgi:hypothetical protein
MVFNIACAALLLQAYLNTGNTGNTRITYTEFALSITQLVLVYFYIVSIFKKAKQIHITVSYLLFFTQIYNIVYTSFIIFYYEEHLTIDDTMFGMSIAVITLNSLSLCGCFGSYKKELEEIGGTPLSCP